MKSKSLMVLLIGIIFLCVAYQPASADSIYATIRGTAADPQGAVIADAQVVATNTATGVNYTTKSQPNGLYQFLQLPIGTYNVTATKQGFKSYKSTGITLVVNQIYDLPIRLEVGVVSETVEVKADAVQVETSSNQQQTLINSQQIVDLPLIGRNFTQLEQLAPGVMASSDRFGTFAVNGSQTQQSSFLINGTDSNDIALNTPGLLPSPDALQEFNLISSTINPEYGRNSGGIVNALIKNGTNQYHGNVFEFYRDTFLNTHNYFALTAPVFHQNLLGGTFGGPIRKDKTFFFLSYQGIRNRTSVNQLDTVFSAAERGGDFSGSFLNGTAQAARMLRNTRPTGVPLVGDDGLTHAAGTPWFGTGTTGAIFNCGATPAATGSLAGFVCPNPSFGHIPTSNFNSISSNFLANFVPLPNTTANGFSFNPLTGTIADQGIARIDHNLTQNDLLWGVAIFNHNAGTQDLGFTGATLPGFPTISQADTKEFTVSYSHTFNSSTLNEVRLGYHRLNFLAVEPAKPALPSSFGFTGINPQNTAAAGAPTIAITGMFTLGLTDNGPQPRKDQNYQVTDNFSKIAGRHTMKFGFDGRRFTVDNPFSFLNNGHFGFGGAGSRSSRDPGLDFLVGTADSFAQNSGGIINARAYEYYAYAQDSWKVKSNLTVNYGAGYQIDTPFNNNQFGGLAYSCFQPGAQSTLFPTAPAGLLFPGDAGIPGTSGCNNSGTRIRYGHVGPRVGFAWSPDLGRISGGSGSKFSIRGGYGIYFNRFEEETALQNLGTPPFGLGSNGIGDAGQRVNFANPWTTPTGSVTIPNKFPFTPPPVGNTTFDFGFFEPMSINTNDPNLSTPYSENFNLNLQREFPGNTVFSVGYVGALGRHLYRAYEGNPITLAGQAACRVDPTCNSGNGQFLQHLLFPDHSLVDGSIFGSVGTQHTDGNSSYHALQANVTKGMTHGLQLIASYTWSHTIDNGSGFENSGFGTRGTNVFFPSLNVGDSANDARQRLVMGYVYAVPGLHNHFSWASDRIFGGWKLSGITTFQTGFPINMSDSGFTSLSCDAFSFYGCADNPNQVASAVHVLDPRSAGATFNGTKNFWFDPSSFAIAPVGTFGNTGRNSLHGPGLNNTDLAILKDTKITEHTNLQVGIEGFNLFNHTQFNNPSGNIESVNFGHITSAAPGRLVQLRAKFNF
jgi:hypothetical protein